MASASSAPAPAPAPPLSPGSIVKRVTSTVASSSRKAFDLISPPPIRREDLKAGDHIYSWRAAYSYAHHGIYVGEGKVIHFTRGEGEELGIGGGGGLALIDRILLTSSASRATQGGDDGGQCRRCGLGKESRGVVLSCLDCFLWGGGQSLHRFEYGESVAAFLARARGGTCSLAPADAPRLVLHRASYLLRFGGFGVYDVFRNNCEDFAVYCKTGLVVVRSASSASPSASPSASSASAFADFWPTASAVVGTSGQAASAVGAPLAALASSPVLAFLSTAAEPWGFAVAAAGLYCAGRYAADLRNRPDAARIPVEDLVASLRLRLRPRPPFSDPAAKKREITIGYNSD